MTPAETESRIRVLLVEDNPDDAVLICRSLERAGCRCAARVVGTLAEFDVALTLETWDLVIADMALPGFNGHDVLQHARKARPALPVIALSGLSRDPRGPEMLAAGATEFVQKSHLAGLADAVHRIGSALAPQLSAEPPGTGASP